MSAITAAAKTPSVVHSEILNAFLEYSEAT